MGYWKSRVVPTMKKLFERIPTKKALVVETSKSLTFDDSKEAINKEIEEKRTELEPKVVEIYEATSAELKALVKEPKEDGLMKHSAEVHKFLEALVEIGFPGSKAACEVSSTSSGPVTFIFEKVCLFLPGDKSREVDIVEEVVKTEEPAKEEEVISGDKEIEIVEEKKEEVQQAPVPAPAAAEVKKTDVEEEKKVTVEEKKPAVEEEKKAAAEDKKPVEEVKKKLLLQRQWLKLHRPRPQKLWWLKLRPRLLKLRRRLQKLRPRLQKRRRLSHKKLEFFHNTFL